MQGLRSRSDKMGMETTGILFDKKVPIGMYQNARTLIGGQPIFNALISDGTDTPLSLIHI